MAEIKANKIEVNTLFREFWFLIPEYQRSYVWKEDNINDLLDDLWYAYLNRSDNEYFLGSLVLKKTEEKEFREFEVLDGQQRLTTFFILMGVLRDIADNQQLKTAYHNRVYQEKDDFQSVPERVRIIYKIRDNVEEFIKKYIIERKGTVKVDEIKNASNEKNTSINHLSNAILTTRKFFENKAQKEIEKYSIFLAKKATFIYVSTESMEDAFRMFTILNNRGVPLTNADILKSINIGIIEKDNQEKYAQIWETIENDLGRDFDRFLSFIRTVYVKEKARLNLLDEFSENIYKKQRLGKGIKTVKTIQNYKGHYDKIISFQTETNLQNEYKNLLTIMQIGLPSTDWVPPLLSYYDNYGEDRIFEFLKKLEHKVSTDWIIQLTPTQRIDNLNAILKEIEKHKTPDELLSNTELFIIDEIELKNRLSGNVYGRRFARYILLKYESLTGDNTVHLSNYKTISVEHVLPQNPEKDSNWVKLFNEEEREDWTNKLANLVLISKRKNSSLSNLNFKEKKRRYLKGRIDVFPSSKIFQEYEKWEKEILRERQKKMVDILTVNTL